MKLELNKKNVELLEGEPIDQGISIYLPLSKTGRERDNDRVRLENLLKNAARQIIASGASKSVAREAVEPGFKLAQDHFFWKTKAAGLAFFINPAKTVRYFELPAAANEYLYVGKDFDTALLRKAMEKDLNFFLLAASKNSLAFYHAIDEKLHLIPVPGLPENVKNLAPDKKFEKQLQSHGRSPQGKREIMHGHGGEKDVQKSLETRYFTEINKALHEFLRDKERPLLFAGDGGLFSIYRKINTYPHLMEKSLAGNFDQMPLPNLFKKASTLLKNASLS